MLVNQLQHVYWRYLLTTDGSIVELKASNLTSWTQLATLLSLK